MKRKAGVGTGHSIEHRKGSKPPAGNGSARTSSGVISYLLEHSKLDCKDLGGQLYVK